MATFNVTKRAFARERLTVTNAVKVLTASVYAQVIAPAPSLRQGNAAFNKKASGARIVPGGTSGDINFTTDGTAPTADATVAGVGTIAGARDVITLESEDAIRNFKTIALTATDAIIEVEYYR